MARPNFFIAGAPRAGTTSLYEYLAAHPDIFMSTRKEPQFFGSDLTRQPRNNYKFLQTEQQYLALFNNARAEKWIGEASTAYFFSENAAAEMRTFSPAAKIILAVRNPVDLMYSLYHQQVALGYEDQPTFEEALAAEPQRKAGRQTNTAQIAEGLYYRHIAQQSHHVARFFSVFGRENVFVVVFDDFKANTADYYRRILEFLQVAPNFVPNFDIANANKTPRNRFLRDFLQNPPQIIVSIGSAVTPISRPIYRHLRKLNTRYVERVPLDPKLRHQLQAEFLPEITALSNLLDRDLTHWGKSERERA